jgi:predicted dehydrogenase
MAVATKPRLGFVGVGWIGRNRLEAVEASGIAEVAAVADPAVEDCFDSLDELLARDLDGIVVATPSALHAEQASAALARGLAVFCQKPLGRTAAEAAAVVDTARLADRLLEVDFAYRFTEAAQRVRELVQGGELGEVYATELVFHNAYGPDKPWFYDASLAGGGCVIDLGIHLVDLALWVLDFPRVEVVSSRLFADGAALERPPHEVEDFAVAQLDLADGSVARVTCSWNLPAGRDCAFEATFYGTRGAASMRNVGGSFYDFVAERYDGRVRSTLAAPPDAWPGRAAVEWARRLAAGERFDPAVARVVDVATIIDRIYGWDA